MLFLKQSTSVTVQFGPFVDAGDGVVLEVGLATAMDNATTGIRLSKVGGALADRADATAPAYDAMGFYQVVLGTGDTDTLGTLLMCFEEAATCLPGWMEFMVMPANVWDSMFGADKLQVDVTQVGGSAEDLPTATALATAQADLDTLTDARGEPAQGAMPESASSNTKLDYLYKTLVNKKTASPTLTEVYNFAGTVVDHKRVTSLTGAPLYTEELFLSGP